MFIKINRKIGVLVLITFTISPLNAATDKAIHCPPVEQIQFQDNRLVGYNNEHRQFISDDTVCSYCDDIYKKAINFHPELSEYFENNKTLACAYNMEIFISTRPPEKIIKKLFNHGDY